MKHQKFPKLECAKSRVQEPPLLSVLHGGIPAKIKTGFLAGINTSLKQSSMHASFIVTTVCIYMHKSNQDSVGYLL